MQRTHPLFTIAAFLLASTACCRELKLLQIECCENGFSLQSDFVTVDTSEDAVEVKTPAARVSTSPSGTVVETPLVKVDTRGEVTVKIGSGEVMVLTTTQQGAVELDIGKDGKLVKVFVDEEGEGSATVAEEDIVVDFSDETGLILVWVGEGGKISDVKVDGDGKGKVEVGESGKIAVVDLTGKGQDLDVGGKEEAWKKGEEKREEEALKIDVTGDDGTSTLVTVKGAEVVEATKAK